MPITQRIYRERRGTAILAVVLYAPRRNQQRTNEHVDPQHDVEQAEKAGKANAEQVNAAFKFDRL